MLVCKLDNLVVEVEEGVKLLYVFLRIRVISYRLEKTERIGCALGNGCKLYCKFVGSSGVDSALRKSLTRLRAQKLFSLAHGRNIVGRIKLTNGFVEKLCRVVVAALHSGNGFGV